MVYLLKKAQYGLKWSPIAWYNWMENYLLNLDFEKSLREPSFYVEKVVSNSIIISLYVDDLLVTAYNIGLK